MTRPRPIAPHLVLVGGFLGAGKTTLILAAARLLEARGLRCAVILNDQSDSLVDTRLAEHRGIAFDEVAGGCFCCRFNDLLDAADRLAAYDPDVIFAEPVGSCTDIVATTIRPLQQLFPDRFRIAPFTVLVDPARAMDLSNPDTFFLFENQLAEADIVCVSKSDLHHSTRLPYARKLSAATGLGVAEWLDEILGNALPAGQFGLDLDYERYAEAEASLVWFNYSATIETDPPLSPAQLLGPLFESLSQSIDIVHLKATDDADSGFLKVATCSRHHTPTVEGNLDASPSYRHRIRINLRAHGDPDRIAAIYKTNPIPGRVADERVACFRPAAPRPTHRLTTSVSITESDPFLNL